MALIDIHTHILYGVDDGAKDINDSMGLLDEEREQGVDQVILTPHYGPKFGHPDTEVLREKFEAIREKAHKYYPEIQLYLGSRRSFHRFKKRFNNKFKPLHSRISKKRTSLFIVFRRSC